MRDSLLGRLRLSPQIELRTVLRLLIIAGILFASVYVVPRLQGQRLWIVLAVPPLIAGVILLLRHPQWGLLALIPVALVVPFTIGTGTQTSIPLAVPLVAVLTSLWVFNMLVQRRVHLLRSGVLFSLCCLAAAAVLSFINGQLPWFGVGGAPLSSQLGGLAIFLLSAAVVLLIAHQVDDMRWLRWIVWSFLGLGALFVLGQLTQPGVITGYLFPAGATGGLFWVWLTGLAVAQAVFNTTLTRFWRLALGLLAMATVALGLLNFEWKSGWLPAAVAAAVVVWLSVPRFRLLLLLAFAAVALPYAVDAVNALIVNDLYSWNTRVLAWRIVLEIAQVSPVFGLGPANYYFYTSLIPILGYRVQFNSHNQYVDLIAQTGLVGMLCFLWFAWAIGRLAWRLFHGLPGGFEQAYAAGVFAGLVGTLVASMLGDWLLPFVYNIGFTGYRSAILAWIFFGGLLAVEKLNRGCFETRSFHSIKTPGFKQSKV